jgi:hypothetical protein
MTKLISGLLSIFCASFAINALAAESHCTAQETTLFTCSAGKKIISVCASKDLNKSAGYMQYRFGPKNAPEMQLPPSKSHPDSSIKSGLLMYSGGGGAHLRFPKADYEYVVYTAIGKGWGIKEGVAVQKAGKLVANVPCKNAAESKLGSDWFDKAGLVADEQEFELP